MFIQGDIEPKGIDRKCSTTLVQDGRHDCTEEDVVTEEGIPTKHRSRSVGDKINTNQAPQ